MPVRFTRRTVSTETFESAGVFDVNGDGVLDIVSGEFWYQGPDYRKRHPIGAVQRIGEYYDDFSTIAMDIDGDGRLDFITGGWWGNTLRWRQNPGDPAKPWAEHVIAETGHIETTRAWDIDGDGHLEVVPNAPLGPLAAYKLIRDAAGRPTAQFERLVLCERPQGHGLGCGDIAGHGRMDFVFAKGWLEAPAQPWKQPWILHDDFDCGRWDASIPILVADVNGDGVSDLIVGGAHGYGLDWWEQKRSAAGRTWIKHPIDPCNAQYHDLHWVDIDGCGKPELVTGKRDRAHNGNDPGEFDDLGLYYFKWTGEGFAKQVIAYGPPGVGKGCGIHFVLADLRKTGRLDIVAPGKDGLAIFYNEGL
jgi:hypothetical protein